jgi:hypothetical protein
MHAAMPTPMLPVENNAAAHIAMSTQLTVHPYTSTCFISFSLLMLHNTESVQSFNHLKQIKCSTVQVFTKSVILGTVRVTIL